jgi:hypothetical protein
MASLVVDLDLDLDDVSFDDLRVLVCLRRLDLSVPESLVLR